MINQASSQIPLEREEYLKILKRVLDERRRWTVGQVAELLDITVAELSQRVGVELKEEEILYGRLFG